ncbi:MAG: hypothetical protein K2W82_04090 [Candidatus Obscuribacterales bacterium]|nr:hypothetical protein [Candidatus Obscuribacterales bacterium]
MLKLSAKNLFVLGSLVCLGFSISQPANADDWRRNNGPNRGYYGYNPSYNPQGGFGNNRVDMTQNGVNAAISRGIASGRLTRGEANSLMNRQRQIDQMQARYSADGRLSRNERNKLNSKVADLQARLWQELRDRNIR